MKNTAKKLLSGVFTDFKENSSVSSVSANDTSLQRFLSLSQERQTLFLHTLGVHKNYEVDDTLSLINSGVFSSLYKSVDKIAFWRKHYHVDDFVQSSLMETVHMIYRNVCKRDVQLAELTTICRYKSESKGQATSGALISHALKNALSHRGFERRFHNPELAIYANHIPANEGNISPDCLDDLIAQGLQQEKSIKTSVADKISYTPHINNVIEMIVQPINEIENRSYSIDLTMLDMEKILASDNLYERYNTFINECAKYDIDISDHAIIDQPVVREIEHLRLQYPIEDMYFYDADLFVLNAIRCLFKRDPFPIESFTLSQMLVTLGKKDVLTYLVASRASRASLSFENIERIDVLEEDFARFAEVMRDPMSGGIELRNRYCVEKRNNYRLWLSNKETLEGYLQNTRNNNQALYSLYYHLCRADSEFALPDYELAEEGKIENWLTVDGTFMNSSKLEESMLVLQPEVAFDISSMAMAKKDSLINFHHIEPGGAWSNAGSSHLIFSVSGDELDHATHDYSISIRLRSYGSKKVPAREINVSVVSNRPGSEQVEVKGIVSDDDTKLFSLPLNDVAKTSFHIARFCISSVTNPAVLEGSTDNRDLGLMLQQVTIHRVAKQIIDIRDEEVGAIEKVA